MLLWLLFFLGGFGSSRCRSRLLHLLFLALLGFGFCARRLFRLVLLTSIHIFAPFCPAGPKMGMKKAPFRMLLSTNIKLPMEMGPYFYGPAGNNGVLSFCVTTARDLPGRRSILLRLFWPIWRVVATKSTTSDRHLNYCIPSISNLLLFVKRQIVPDSLRISLIILHQRSDYRVFPARVVSFYCQPDN